MLALNKIPWVRISAYHVIPRFIFPGEICRDFSAEFPVNVPEKPKKPPTPYIRYFQENRSIFEREYPTANYRDIMKIASEKWRLCSPDIKKPYEEAYAKDKENYLHKRDSFENALTEDQQMVLEEMEDKARRKREKSKLKKGLKELGKPKTPPGSYALFFATKKGQKIPGESLREWGSRIGAEWKNMPEIEKQPYFEQAKALRLQYEKDIDSWRKEALQFKSENPVVKKAQRKLRLQEERQREKLFSQWRKP